VALRAFNDHRRNVACYLVEAHFDLGCRSVRRHLDIDGFGDISHSTHRQRNVAASHSGESKAAVGPGARDPNRLPRSIQHQLRARNRSFRRIDYDSIDLELVVGLHLRDQRRSIDKGKYEQAFGQQPGKGRAHSLLREDHTLTL